MTSTPEPTRDISSGMTRATTGWRSPEELGIDLNDPTQRRFGDYELVEKIGQGGMGVVYRARQHALDRDVALKLLAAGPTASEGFVERFRSEARSAARMQHPNIVEVYEFGHRDGINFFSMRLIEGETLAKRVARAGALKPREAAALMRTLAEAIDYAHRLGVLHLDLKPANVLLTREGTPLVADFGLARRIDAGHEGEYEISGTPSYMSPEQAQPHAGPPGPPADIYGLGAILYECLLARPPFDGGTVSGTLERVVSEDVARPRSIDRKIPADLEAICLKCLAKSPAQRYATARALSDDLGSFLEGRPVQARKLWPHARAFRWAKRQPWKATALAAMLAIAALIAGAAWSTYQVVVGIFDDLLFAAIESTGTGRAFLAEWNFSPPNWTSAEDRASWSGRIRRNLIEQAARRETIGTTAEVVASFATDDTALRQAADRRLVSLPGMQSAKDDVLLLLATGEDWSEARLPDAIAALRNTGTDSDGTLLMLEGCRGKRTPPCDPASLEARVETTASDNAAAWIALASRPGLADSERVRLIERGAKATQWRNLDELAYERLPIVFVETLAISRDSYPLSADLARPKAVANFVAFSSVKAWPMATSSALVKPCMKTVQPAGSPLRESCLALSRTLAKARSMGDTDLSAEIAFTQAASEAERAPLREWRRQFVWIGDANWRLVAMLEPSGPGKFLEKFAQSGELEAARDVLSRNRIPLAPPPDWRPNSPDFLRFALERAQARAAKK